MVRVSAIISKYNYFKFLFKLAFKPPGSSSCVIPVGFDLFQGNYYKLESNEQPLVEAKRMCNQVGGHLAEFRSEEQLNKLLSFIECKFRILLFISQALWSIFLAHLNSIQKQYAIFFNQF